MMSNELQYYTSTPLQYDLHNVRRNLIKQTRPQPSFLQFIDLLPISEISITLGEGDTPTISANNLGIKYGIENLWVKDESRNPTMSFKDRESVVLVNYLLENNITEVNLASSGNAAISTSLYCNIANIKCNCYVPSTISRSKKLMLSSLGVNLHLLEGTYEDVYRHLVDKGKLFNATSGQNNIRGEGDKTISYELAVQIPKIDIVIVPSGNGENLAAIWRGFKELKTLGYLSNLPQLFAVQIKGASPLKEALEKGKNYHIVQNPSFSHAEGIVASESFVSPLAVNAIKESLGDVVEVSDQDIINAIRDAIRYEGLIPEFTSGSAFAALKEIKPGKANVVVINTAGGMKEFQELSKIISF